MKLNTGFILLIAVVLVVGMSGIGAAAGLGKYKNVEKAVDDGYLPPSAVGAPECVPEMGIHYINPAHLDGHVQVGQPEALVYAKTGNGLKLIGVEYLSTSPFSAFGQDSELSDPPGFHALHAWLFTDAPNGKYEHHSGDVNEACNYIG